MNRQSIPVQTVLAKLLAIGLVLTPTDVTMISAAAAASTGASLQEQEPISGGDGDTEATPRAPRENDQNDGKRGARDKSRDSVPPEKGFAWNGGPSLRLEHLRVDFKVRLQEDMRGSYEGADMAADLSTFALERARVGVEGRLFTHLDFEVERELAAEDLTPQELAQGMTQESAWKDLYVDVGYLKAAQLQAGRFKIPFGLDQLTSPTRNDFVYRSVGAEYLAPGRDTGVMLHGRFLNRLFSYWAGLFQHDGDNARSKKIQGGDITLAWRATTMPFRRAADRRVGSLEVGGAYMISELSDDPSRPNGLRARTVMTEESFFDPVYVKGRRYRWESEVDWMVGQSSIRAEYTHVTDDRLRQGLNDQDLPDARYRSTYLSGTYVLTGERKTRPITPAHPLGQGGVGALEVAGRYEWIRCDSVEAGTLPLRNPRAATILPSGDRVFTIGMNWILNRWLLVQINGIRELIDDPARNPSPGGGAFWSRVVRLQFTV